MVGQKMLRVKPGQLRTVELGQESKGTVLHHIVIALTLISRPHEISRHIGLPPKRVAPQFVCFFSFYFQSDVVFTQQLQFFFYTHGSSSLLRLIAFRPVPPRLSWRRNQIYTAAVPARSRQTHRKSIRSRPDTPISHTASHAPRSRPLPDSSNRYGRSG